jgi:phospholipase C
MSSRSPRTNLRGRSLVVKVVSVCSIMIASTACGSGGSNGRPLVGIHKIQHVIVIMQENVSFDRYFGIYPGADGIPMQDGKPSVCVPDRAHGGCVRPFPDHLDVNGSGPHDAAAARGDVDGGKMDGFVAAVEAPVPACKDSTNPICGYGLSFSRRHPNSVMAYLTGTDLPNYWSYAKNFVLQDHMFEPNASWSLPAHLFQVSEWSAACADHSPSSCVNALDTPGVSVPDGNPLQRQPKGPIYAWTDLTYLLHKKHVNWGWYVVSGTEPDCANDAALSCLPKHQDAQTPGIWNPLPYFDTVKSDGQLKNIQSVSRFYDAASKGTLPAVSWVLPSGAVSEHWPAKVSDGVAYVTSLVNAVMRGPDWDSTAIFVAWDDWGGLYDHVVPPTVDQNGYGLRVPGLVISPYAKHGYVDHQTLSFDAYAKFIEDDFLGGQRLDPRTDGRPDPRPSVRENEKILGDLANDFDFNQSPQPPTILAVHPKTTLISP